MSWLIIETTDRAGGVAWGSSMDDLKCETWEPGARHGEVLWPAIRRLAGDRLEGIEGVIAGVGPGRLTGVRLGLTVAKVICKTCGVPLVLVDRFEQIAADANQVSSLVATVPLMGHRLAAQGFRWEGAWVKTGEPMFCLDQNLDALAAALGTEPPALVAGTGLEAHADALRALWPSAQIQEIGREPGDVRWLAEVGLAKAARGETTALDGVRPVYYA